MTQFYNKFNNLAEICKQHCKMANSFTLQYRQSMDFNDMYRYAYIYIISALDLYIHEISNYGLISYLNNPNKFPTAKNKSFMIPSHLLFIEDINQKQNEIRDYVVKKNGQYSYQNSENISSGLSHIWDEPHKWQQIADKLNITQKETTDKLNLIIDRRNQIVHEGDVDPGSGLLYPINFEDTMRVIDFIVEVVKSIDKLVFK